MIQFLFNFSNNDLMDVRCMERNKDNLLLVLKSESRPPQKHESLQISETFPWALLNFQEAIVHSPLQLTPRWPPRLHPSFHSIWFYKQALQSVGERQPKVPELCILFSFELLWTVIFFFFVCRIVSWMLHYAAIIYFLAAAENILMCFLFLRQTEDGGRTLSAGPDCWQEGPVLSVWPPCQEEKKKRSKTHTLCLPHTLTLRSHVLCAR